MKKSDEETCSTRLELGLGVGEHYYGARPTKDDHNKQPLICFDLRFASLCPKDYNDSGHEDRCSKKLKLTKDQSSVLENCFNSNTILNPAQKQALAEQLKLKQRQIEVWFQNRRARTKLKQTEDEHEILKIRCEFLTNENRKLRDELRNLRSLIKFEPYDHELIPIPYTNPSNQMAIQLKD